MSTKLSDIDPSSQPAAWPAGAAASSDEAAGTAAANDPVLNRLVEELTEKLQAGERVNLSEYAASYPDQAERLRRLWPALRMLANMSDSAVLKIQQDRGSSALGEPLPELGDYQLVREIGRGGMGVVYEARQVSLGRRVALKVLPFASALDRGQLDRFRTEAHAAAQLHHTNIVPVFSIGCDRGVHYYAMQFIDGRTLAQIVHEQKQAEPRERDPSPPQSRTSLLASTGQRRASAWSPSWASRPPKPSITPIAWPSSTATSSPPICCSTCAATSGSPISAWPGSRTRRD